jgi:acetyl-CoA carboxylase biotin carboxyl carrier protein
VGAIIGGNIMDFNGIGELIEKVNSTDIAYFEYKTNDGHIKMDKSLMRNISSGATKTEESNIEVKKEVVSNNTQADVVASMSEVKTSTTLDTEDLKVITSPMVGTFYSTPSPDSPAFVKAGDSVNTGDVLCIIEAMKLMNEIECETNGVIKQILVKDGDMVEYGQPLFKIKED